MADTNLIWLLIENENTVLVAHRKQDESPFAGEWTLPGDVLNQGESAAKLIAQVGADELDVEIMGHEPYTTLQLSDGDDSYSVQVHRCGYQGRPRFRESGPYDQVGWAPRSELMDKNAFPLLADIASRLAQAG